MYKKMLKRLLWRGRLQLHPVARRFDAFGRELTPIADDWILADIDKRTAQLRNTRTGHVMMLSLRYLRNFDFDRSRNCDGLIYGFLNLRRQANISGRDLWFEELAS